MWCRHLDANIQNGPSKHEPLNNRRAASTPSLQLLSWVLIYRVWFLPGFRDSGQRRGHGSETHAVASQDSAGCQCKHSLHASFTITRQAWRLWTSLGTFCFRIPTVRERSEVPITWKITSANLALHPSYKTNLLPWYLFQVSSTSSFPLISSPPCPKPFNMRCNPKSNTTRESQKQPPGWWEVSHLIFSANRKVKYLTLCFRSDPCLCFSAFINHCCMGKRPKEEYQLSFTAQRPIQKRHPVLQEPKCFFKCFWQKSTESFQDCSLSGEMAFCRVGGGKVAVTVSSFLFFPVTFLQENS